MYNGIINVYKEKGFTSHDVVAKLRGILRQKKIGHTGTLDPDAEGVLPVCLGNATKLCDMFTEKNKAYECVMLLGTVTDTQDISGEVLENCPKEKLENISEQEVREAILSFVGDYDQIPPMYSALKVNGVKLYDLARQGITIDRESRRITIFDINIKNICLPEVTMEVTCSKGTYIRTLCNDIGEKLGTGGCMKGLLRTKSGQFFIKDSLKLNEIEKLRDQEKLEEYIITTENSLNLYGMLETLPTGDKLLYNGNPLPKDKAVVKSEADDIDKMGIYRAYDSKGEFFGLYRFDKGKNIYRNEKMFL